jgi:NTP pyrophosphatase (non-canonical NTP hydrolase)
LIEKKSLEQMGLKLSEEVGELSQALLSYLGASGSEYKELGLQDVKEECADVILVALSLVYKLGSDDTELIELMNKKVEKWKDKTNK